MTPASSPDLYYLPPGGNPDRSSDPRLRARGSPAPTHFARVGDLHWTPIAPGETPPPVPAASKARPGATLAGMV
jgi:hypothetical protein